MSFNLGKVEVRIKFVHECAYFSVEIIYILLRG